MMIAGRREGAKAQTREAPRARRGVVLVEVLVGGAILAVGLAVLISLASHALAMQQLGEQRVVAASLADELLSSVLAEGPLDFPRTHDLEGLFAAPFERYSYTVEIRDQGEIDPFLVTATIRWNSRGYWREATVQTLISQPRGDLEREVREPGTPISR